MTVGVRPRLTQMSIVEVWWLTRYDRRTGMHPGVAAAAVSRCSRVSSRRLFVSSVKQTPAARHVLRQGKPQSDYLGLFQAAHHELPEAVVGTSHWQVPPWLRVACRCPWQRHLPCALATPPPLACPRAARHDDRGWHHAASAPARRPRRRCRPARRCRRAWRNRRRRGVGPVVRHTARPAHRSLAPACPCRSQGCRPPRRRWRRSGCWRRTARCRPGGSRHRPSSWCVPRHRWWTPVARRVVSLRPASSSRPWPRPATFAASHVRLPGPPDQRPDAPSPVAGSATLR